MKIAALLVAASLLVMLAPVNQAENGTIVQIVLDHLRGIIDEPCVQTDATSRPMDLGSDPQVDSWVDGDWVYVHVMIPGMMIQAQVNPSCLDA